MEPISIERLNIAHLEALQHIGRTTFLETFGERNSAGNMAQYLEQGFATTKIKAELENEHSLFYAAAKNKQLIAYLKLNFGPAQTELQDPASLEIERIYVVQAFHGTGVGALLYDRAIEIALQHQLDYIWLGVWEENKRAIRFYEKNGFVTFDRHLFRVGEEEQTDLMMKKVLR
ncbi:MAG: GNAT family N-acetyltransferase [Sphingobacteriales bacterium]|nr:MAG: GNAT family N-acetyltransferase [Sphingobacteriales bacterium]